ncbi:guanine nucleotide exchange factor [Lipomyces japonicus]|uniref:guanine nucleotide exchange factor n=1 Tax=Lipomyces japonicus TaxID=56871 RepID=UPI0034CD4D65
MPSTDVDAAAALLIQLKDDNFGSDTTLGTLQKLKIYGRNFLVTNYIFKSSEETAIIQKYAKKNKSLQIRLEALRILANALLLRPTLRNLFQDADAIAVDYLDCTVEEEFVASRILFLATAENLTISFSIVQYARAKIEQHAQNYTHRSSTAVQETCKLLFNCLIRSSEGLLDQERLAGNVLTILSQLASTLESPASNLISCLVKLSAVNTGPYIDKLLAILENALQTEEFKKESVILPLLIVIYRTYNEAPESDVLQAVKQKILPTGEERKKPLGTAVSVSGGLLRLVTDPAFPTCRELAYQLFWDSSDQDARKFIHNIGLGYAVGYLVNHGIAVPQDIVENVKDETKYNPVTGQQIDEETHKLSDMTDEEKEREAERLFVLFERLNKNGFIKVENPIRTAVESGRFQELKE